MTSFEELVTVRKDWLNGVLKPWCQQARRIDLLKAELEWVDIAGKVDPQKTLWLWAWSRFPQLVHEILGIEETSEVEIVLRDGRTIHGFPNARNSQSGQLMIWGREGAADQPTKLGPFSIDEVVSVRQSEERGR